MNDLIAQQLTAADIAPALARILGLTATILLIVLLALTAFWLTQRILIRLLILLSTRSKNTWDDALVSQGVVKRIAYLMPIIVIHMSADLMLPGHGVAAEFIKRVSMVFFVATGVWMLDAVLRTARHQYEKSDMARGRSIRVYTDAITIIAYIMAAIFMVSILTDKSPWGVLSILGGFTVVLMLVFKDTILGFVASIQVSGHDMVRVGDWIEMPQYGADGDVIEVTINTVKIRNWDKTITTIPTYCLVSDSVKNWRGMSESGGRRIKRALNIDMNSIRFCTDAMLEQFRRFHLLDDYLSAKAEEIKSYNQQHRIDTSLLINGRRQTNIGVFRAYVIAYLRNHPNIHQGMTFLVRHLEPTSHGLPIQIYVFSNDQQWANYEAIQADIFDHLLAAVDAFGLRLFQHPTGHDFMSWRQDTMADNRDLARPR